MLTNFFSKDLLLFLKQYRNHVKQLYISEPLKFSPNVGLVSDAIELDQNPPEVQPLLICIFK
jgi:hypothetical protein